MKKDNIPVYHATSLYAIPVSFFVERGIRVLLSDLDNTLDFYASPSPSKEALAYKKALEEAGIRLIIASNGKGERVKRFASLLGVTCFTMLCKPFPGPLNKAIATLGIDKSQIALVGDQIQTDVRAANRAKILSILVEPLGKKEPIWTKINRLFDKAKRKKILRLGLTSEIPE